MTLSSYLLFCIALATAAAIPGPGIAALVGRALKSGSLATLPLLMGVAIGDLIWFALAALGLSVIAAAFGSFFVILKYVGVAYLIYLAISFWRAPVDEESLSPAKLRDGFFKTIGLGVAVTLSNPKAITFYLALMPLVLDLKALDGGDFALLALSIVVILFVVLGAYIFMADKARLLFRAPRARRLLNRIAASIMGGAAALIATR